MLLMNSMHFYLFCEDHGKSIPHGPLGQGSKEELVEKLPSRSSPPGVFLMDLLPKFRRSLFELHVKTSRLN